MSNWLSQLDVDSRQLAALANLADIPVDPQKWAAQDISRLREVRHDDRFVDYASSIHDIIRAYDRDVFSAEPVPLAPDAFFRRQTSMAPRYFTPTFIDPELSIFSPRRMLAFPDSWVPISLLADMLDLTYVFNSSAPDFHYVDAHGRLFKLETRADEQGMIFRLVQFLPHARAPEWLFLDDIRQQSEKLFEKYPDIFSVELAYEVSHADTSDYQPHPNRIYRSQASWNLEDHTQQVSDLMGRLGFSPVDGESSAALPVFSLNGDRRFVATVKPAGHTDELESILQLDASLPAPARVTILVTKEDHALRDLLINFKKGFLNGNVFQIVCNHEDANLRALAKEYGIDMVVVDGVGVDHQNKLAAYMAKPENKPDLLVMAKYMRILSPDLINTVGYKNIINIHHGLLPMFAGAMPYHQAADAGVEIVGATAHFATPVLDSGPVIAQESFRVSNSTADLTSIRDLYGRVAESRALTRAVQLWLRKRLSIINDREVEVLKEHRSGESQQAPENINRYLGQVLDARNVMAWMQDNTAPGELHIRQYGNSRERKFLADGREVTVPGPLKKAEMEALLRSMQLSAEWQHIRKIRVTNSLGNTFVFELRPQGGDLISLPSSQAAASGLSTAASSPRHVSASPIVPPVSAVPQWGRVPTTGSATTHAPVVGALTLQPQVLDVAQTLEEMPSVLGSDDDVAAYDVEPANQGHYSFEALQPQRAAQQGSLIAGGLAALPFAVNLVVTGASPLAGGVFSVLPGASFVR